MAHHESPYKRRLPNGQHRWVARYTAPDGRRLSAGTFEKKRDAQDAITAAYTQPQTKGTVGEYAPRWLDEHPVSERTTATNRGRLNVVLDVPIEGRKLRDWPLHELRRRHAKDLVGHMLTVQGRAPEGCRAILRALSSMFEDAITDELAELNPWRGLRIRDDDKRATKQSREPRVWTKEQLHHFAAMAGRYEPMIRMLADCGLRIGELFALERALQDFQTGEFRVTGSAWNGQILESSRNKRHDRRGPIPPGCLELLRAMPVRIDSPWLFPSPTGRLYRIENFRRDIWIPTQKAAGIDPTPQELRHSWVSHMRAAGIDPADLAEIAGHSVVTATGHYVHALNRSYDDVRKAIG